MFLCRLARQIVFILKSLSLPRKGEVIGEGKLRHAKRAGVPLLTFPNFEVKLYFCAGLHGKYVLNQNGL